MTLIPFSTATTSAAAYPASMFSFAWPRYVPAPSEEIVNPCASRKCPSAAWPANFAAYFLVPSCVAPRLISVPRSSHFLLERLPLPLHPSSAPAILRSLAESGDTASLAPEKKSRLPLDCYRTTAPTDSDVRPIPPRSVLCSRRRTLQTEVAPRQPSRPPDTHGLFLPPTAARWYPQNAIQRVPPGGRLVPHIRRLFAALRCVARLQHPGPESC